MKLRYTARAKADLGEIFDYVAQDNPRAAARIIAKIQNNLASLSTNPSLGRPGRVDGTRELVIANFLNSQDSSFDSPTFTAHAATEFAARSASPGQAEWSQAHAETDQCHLS
jgi:hypothetical protein